MPSARIQPVRRPLRLAPLPAVCDVLVAATAADDGDLLERRGPAQNAFERPALATPPSFNHGAAYLPLHSVWQRARDGVCTSVRPMCEPTS